MKAAHHLHLTASRRATLKRYGLDPDDYLALLALQDGRCGICERPFTPARVPNVDHCHDGDQLTRGLLCTRDNHDLLGRFTDDVVFFQGVVAYLLDPPAARLPGPPRRAPGAVP
jgi:Recombination endonuclease VII